jgi:hypothetical protein
MLLRAKKQVLRFVKDDRTKRVNAETAELRTES